jgi:hypothetical protein
MWVVVHHTSCLTCNAECVTWGGWGTAHARQFGAGDGVLSKCSDGGRVQLQGTGSSSSGHCEVCLRLQCVGAQVSSAGSCQTGSP